MKSILLISLFVFSVVVSAKNSVGCEHLCTDYKSNPVGISSTTPRLSWEIVSANRGILQTAYQIRAARTEKELLSNKNLVWSTEKVNSDQSIQIQYGGQPLQSAERIYWQVKIWDNKGGVSDWSKPAFFETGLLLPSDWKASWIEPNIAEDEKKSNPSPLLRKEFELKKEIYVPGRIYNLVLGQKRETPINSMADGATIPVSSGSVIGHDDDIR
jgi:alpha-L-rhamnosidase